MTCSSMPWRPTHHKSSSAPIQAQSAAGPWTWTTNSLVGTSRGSVDPVAVVEPGPGAGAVEHERRVADERQDGLGGTDRELIDTGRRRPQETPAVGRPDGAIRRHAHLLRRLDLERDRLTVEGEQGGLRRRGRDDDQPVAPDTRDGVGLGERGHGQSGAEPKCRRIDQSGFGAGSVEHIRPASAFGDRDRRAVGGGVEADECLTAVTVGENHPTRRLVHEPSRGSRRRGVDCRQPI